MKNPHHTICKAAKARGIEIDIDEDEQAYVFTACGLEIVNPDAKAGLVEMIALLNQEGETIKEAGRAGRAALRGRKTAQAPNAAPAPVRRGRKPKASQATGNITETALTREEIAARLAHFAGDRSAYERLAEANGLKLNPALDNGRTAMTCRNSIRSRALKGDRVVWTY